MGDDDGKKVTINTRSLLQVGALLIGGALGGGGVTFAAAPAEELSALKAVVETVALSVNEIKVEARYARERHDSLKGEVADLKKEVAHTRQRVRDLEIKVK